VSLLSGCVKGGYNTCPPLVVYSEEQQALVADELEQLGLGSELSNMISDYAQLRQQLRYCLGEA